MITVSVVFGKRPASADEGVPRTAVSGLWSGAIASFGLIFMIFFGFKSGFATATEISAFAALYAVVVGSLVFRELSLRTAADSFIQAATRSGLVLFIVAAAQSLAFILTLQQVPHAVGDMMLSLMDAAQRDPELGRLVRAQTEQRRRFATEVIERAVARGDLPVGVDVDLLVTLVAGPLIYTKLVRRQRVTDELVAAVVDTVLSRFQVRAQPTV